MLILLCLNGCNKPKTILICGDHVCINKAEAEQYFEDNLILEVKIVENEKEDDIDLVELNLRSNSDGKKEIEIINKNQTREEIKVLSNDEIEKKKIELKKRKKNKNQKSIDKKQTKEVKLKKPIEKKKPLNKVVKIEKDVNKTKNEITDVCTILEKCSIDEISKFLVKQGKEKKFPDITIRENK